MLACSFPIRRAKLSPIADYLNQSVTSTTIVEPQHAFPKLSVLNKAYLNLPNCLSILRGICAIPFAVAVLNGSWQIAFWILVYAIVSDLLDGPIARRLGLASKTGTRIDHTSDALFVFVGLAVLTQLEITSVTLALPIVQLIAFSEYAYKNSPRQPSLIPSQLGRYNGILYFVVIATVTTQMAFNFTLIPSFLIYTISLFLVASTVFSLALRLSARWNARTHNF